MAVDERLICARFPRSTRYHPDWVRASCSSAANALWLTEWLTEALARVVGRRKTDAPLYEPVASIPAQYEKKPLLRESE